MRYTRVRVLQLDHHNIIIMIQLVSMTLFSLCTLAIIFTQSLFVTLTAKGSDTTVL